MEIVFLCIVAAKVQQYLSRDYGKGDPEKPKPAAVQENSSRPSLRLSDCRKL